MNPDTIVGLLVAVVSAILVIVFIAGALLDQDGQCPECGRGFEFFEEMPDGLCTVCYEEMVLANNFWHDFDGVPSSDMTFLSGF